MRRHDNGLPYVRCVFCGAGVDSSHPQDCRAAGMCGSCVLTRWHNYRDRKDSENMAWGRCTECDEMVELSDLDEYCVCSSCREEQKQELKDKKTRRRRKPKRRKKKLKRREQ